MTTKVQTKLTIRIDAELARLIRHLAVDTGQSLEETCETLMRAGYNDHQLLKHAVEARTEATK